MSNCACQLTSWSNGFTTGTRVFVKSPTFRETIVRLWWIAVAASKPSMVDKGLPLIFAFAASKPQRSATAASIDRILPETCLQFHFQPCFQAASPFAL